MIFTVEYETRSATGGLWIYEDASIPVKAGDTINFWILVFINGGGFQKTDQSGMYRTAYAIRLTSCTCRTRLT